jgi:FtsZ-binding cell division protein ZapB
MMQKIDLIIDALMVSNSTLWSAKIDQALFVARELQLELNEIKDNPMKEQRELQTLIDQLEQHINAQDAEIERLRRDALRYRWLNKYTSQLFMVTEPQMNFEVDRAMSGDMK